VTSSRLDSRRHLVSIRDVISSRSVTSSRLDSWRHLGSIHDDIIVSIRDVISSRFVTSSRLDSWRHLVSIRDVISSRFVTSSRVDSWRHLGTKSTLVHRSEPHKLEQFIRRLVIEYCCLLNLHRQSWKLNYLKFVVITKLIEHFDPTSGLLTALTVED